MKELINNLEYVETLSPMGRKMIKEYVENLEEENLNLREDLYVKKISVEVKDKSLQELIDMPSYNDLKKEVKELTDSLDRAIGNYIAISTMIGEFRNYLEQELNKGGSSIDVAIRVHTFGEAMDKLDELEEKLNECE